jgi:hypothetical protein
MFIVFSMRGLCLASQRLTALAVLLQTLELLHVRAVFADGGVWRFAILRPEQRALPAPLRALCRLLLPYRPFVVLLGLRVLAALWLLGVGELGSALLVPWLCLSQLLIGVRFRGAANGGSDSMTMLLLIALGVASLAGLRGLMCRAALLYIAVQVTFSYVIAGLAKLRQPDWRNGRALCHFVASSPYGEPVWLQRILGRPYCGLLLSWFVMAFECGFPLAWIDQRLCMGLMLLGFGFHLTNAYVFGLNRFVFAWLAAYPALLYGCQFVHSGAGF